MSTYWLDEVSEQAWARIGFDVNADGGTVMYLPRCPICGATAREPGEDHDEDACRTAVAEWKPLGVLGSPDRP